MFVNRFDTLTWVQGYYDAIFNLIESMNNHIQKQL